MVGRSFLTYLPSIVYRLPLPAHSGTSGLLGYLPEMSDDLQRLTAALADRYQVEHELGRGGMATVYLAKDLEHDRQVAIKVMRPQIAAAMGGERFLREIEIAGSLDHPNILALLDSGEADDMMYYVMPFIEGESLGELIERNGPLAVDDALRITREVASALTYASGQGVVHRDIKPDNIMITAEGHAVVMDFGIGKALEAGGEKLTQTGMSVGTPAYMSPEQAMGERDIDGRTDVYSLAAVVYEMLVGEQPFTGPTAQVIIAKRFSGEVPSARTRREVVPPAMDMAIQRALAIDRKDRFATAEELVAAMTGEGEPAKASPAKRLGCGSTAAVLMVVLALVVVLAMSV